MSARLIVTMLLVGGLAFSGALVVSSLAGNEDAPASSGGVPPVPLNLESSTSQAESAERSAGLPTLAPRTRKRRPKTQVAAPPPPAYTAPPAAPSAPPPAAYSPPVTVTPPAAPAPAPAPKPAAPEPPVDFLNSG